jgi:predicted MPP superfamily phosphohydrolase
MNVTEGVPVAMRWGDYNCDTPHRTLKAMFDFIAHEQKQIGIDFITWTGDNTAHDIWEQNDQLNTQSTANLTQTLKDSLGPDSTIDIFPALGNHDVWPVNVQDFTHPNSNYPINHIAQEWTDKNWLTEEEAQ